jgi:hypothetical protein
MRGPSSSQAWKPRRAWTFASSRIFHLAFASFLASALLPQSAQRSSSQTLVAQLVPATTPPSPPASFSEKRQDLVRDDVLNGYLEPHQPQEYIDVAHFGVMLAHVLRIEEPSSATAPPGVAHWYYSALSSLADLFNWVIANTAHAVARTLAAIFPSGINAASSLLRIIPIDRQTAAAVAMAGAYKMSVIHGEPVSLASPPPFADESEISPGVVERACHEAVEAGLLTVKADNRFHPHHWLTWDEAVNVMEVLGFDRLNKQP